MAAKSQPLAVGDRVRNCRAGVGTVMALEQFDGDLYVTACASTHLHRANMFFGSTTSNA